MFTTVIIAACGVLAIQGATIDRGNCVDVAAGYGQDVNCPFGYVAIGACASGKNLDCDGSSHVLRCCAVIDGKEKMACLTESGNWGEYIECPIGLQVNGMCASGENHDCGDNISHRIMCCDDNGISTDGTSCRTVSAYWGAHIDCGSNEVMTGLCASGGNLDCDGDSHILQCCEYQ